MSPEQSPTNNPLLNKKLWPEKDYRPKSNLSWEQKVKAWGKPEAGKTYACEIQHHGTGLVKQEKLKWHVEYDCGGFQFHTADDGSELDHWNWNIIKWVKVK